MSTLLELRHVHKSFGGVHAVNDVSFTLDKGGIIGLIGPNGAGKTTVVNLIAGVLRPSAGAVFYDGAAVNWRRPFRAARAGIARTFQIVQPFPAMTVLENVTAGAMFGGGIPSQAQARELAREELAFVGLDRAANAPASSLPLPDRKRLEFAKSLAMRPRILLLDEVNAGLNNAEVDAALALIRRVSERGVTIVIIEHLMKVVLTVSDRVLVLHHGKLIADGTPDSIVRDDNVIDAYLGTRFAERYRRGDAFA